MNRAQRKAKEKAEKKAGIFIDKSKQNAGGFYEGMAGVWLDKDGNRRVYEIVITPEAEAISKIGAHPQQIAECLVTLMEVDALTRASFISAVRRYKLSKRSKLVKWIYRSLDRIKGIIKTTRNIKILKKKAVSTVGMSQEQYEKEIQKIRENDQEDNTPMIDINNVKTEA